jgi:hypothetical protein
MAVDIFLNPATDDIDISSNKTMRLTSNIEESSRQQVLINLATFKGEWFANILSGLPYLKNDNNPEQLMGQTETLNFDIAIKEGILSRENITSLASYTSEFDRQERVFTVSFTAITNTGEVITVDDLSVVI